MEIPNKYVPPCKTNGNCRRDLLAAHGITLPYRPRNNPLYGMSFIQFEPANLPNGEVNWKQRVAFKCCTGCHQPINQAEATRLNDEIGLELPSTDSLRDRMAKLKSKVRNTQ